MRTDIHKLLLAIPSICVVQREFINGALLNLQDASKVLHLHGESSSVALQATLHSTEEPDSTFGGCAEGFHVSHPVFSGSVERPLSQ